MELQRQARSLASQGFCAGAVHTAVLSDAEAEPAPHLLSLHGCLARQRRTYAPWLGTGDAFRPLRFSFKPAPPWPRLPQLSCCLLVSSVNSPSRFHFSCLGFWALLSCSEPGRALINLSALTAWIQATSQMSGKSVIKSLVVSCGEFKSKPWIVIKLKALQEER